MNDNIAFISDIHGNLQALEAVLKDIGGLGIKEIICLGDIVGYGGNPVECVERVREACAVSLIGNHDHYAAHDGPVKGARSGVSEVIQWTRQQLSDEQRQWLRDRLVSHEGDDYQAVHASLHNPIEWPYIILAGAAELHFKHQVKPVCFVGHTHQPTMWLEGEEGAVGKTSLENLRPGRKQVVNVGSVGQPRDGDERACYLVYRRPHADVWWRRVPYDIEAAETAIINAGLPPEYAARLSVGK